MIIKRIDCVFHTCGLVKIVYCTINFLQSVAGESSTSVLLIHHREGSNVELYGVILWYIDNG